MGTCVQDGGKKIPYKAARMRCCHSASPAPSTGSFACVLALRPIFNQFNWLLFSHTTMRPGFGWLPNT